MPAVFGTAELLGSCRWLLRMGRGPVVAPTPTTVAAMFGTGWLMLAVLLAWPQYGFPFLWGAVYLILEPVNVHLGHRSLLEDTARGDWRRPVALSLGCLTCGVLWEMWNYYSYPRWVYHVPFVGVLHVFEMPLLGYLGYLVFAWELHALYHLVVGPFGRGASVLRIGPVASGQHGCPDRGGDTYQLWWETTVPHRERWSDMLGDGAESPSSVSCPWVRWRWGFLRFRLPS
jgi:hypothetical protein